MRGHTERAVYFRVGGLHVESNFQNLLAALNCSFVICHCSFVIVRHVRWDSADVYVPNWAEGRDAAFDITVINPLQQATVAQAAETPGHSLDFAFNRKMRGAADECERQGVAFIPLAFESLGGWHKAAEKQVKKLAQAVTRQTGGDESECSSQATSRLSLLLMKGNSAILINRIPSAPDPVIDGVE